MCWIGCRVWSRTRRSSGSSRRCRPRAVVPTAVVDERRHRSPRPAGRGGVRGVQGSLAWEPPVRPRVLRIRVLPVTHVKLAVIAGDGIGTEVVAEGLKVLDAVAPSAGITVSTTEYDLGRPSLQRDGRDPAGVGAGRAAGQDAILLGAIGDPSVPPGVLERGVLLPLRFELDHHVNLRPVKLFPGVATPAGGQGPGGHRHGGLPRGHRGARTSAPAARCAAAPPTRSPRRRA